MPSPGRELHHTEDKEPAKPEPAGLGEDEQIDVVARASVIHSEGAGHGHQPNEWEPADPRPVPSGDRPELGRCRDTLPPDMGEEAPTPPVKPIPGLPGLRAQFAIAI